MARVSYRLKIIYVILIIICGLLVIVYLCKTQGINDKFADEGYPKKLFSILSEIDYKKKNSPQFDTWKESGGIMTFNGSSYILAVDFDSVIKNQNLSVVFEKKLFDKMDVRSVRPYINEVFIGTHFSKGDYMVSIGNFYGSKGSKLDEVFVLVTNQEITFSNSDGLNLADFLNNYFDDTEIYLDEGDIGFTLEGDNVKGIGKLTSKADVEKQLQQCGLTIQELIEINQGVKDFSREKIMEATKEPK